MRLSRAIAPLPQELINQIAAGEVVERPASVVKELCDNAIDGGATRIVVEIQGGGRRLIRVVDDGIGIAENQLDLAVTRHATSKLSALDDLWDLPTHGFRGEALSSIAAVSRLSLTSRSVDATAGSRIEIEGGVIGDRYQVGVPIGTIVEVRDLFFNVRARQKFLKSDTTESAAVSEVLFRLALAHPTIHFKLIVQERATFEALPATDRETRVRQLFGAQGGELFFAESDPPIRVQALLGPASMALSSTRGIHFVVGMRPIRDRALVSAVVEAFARVLPAGRAPQAVIYIDLAPGAYDINVHPQKSEVRFARPGDVLAAVKLAVSLGIADAGWELESEGAYAVDFGRSAVSAEKIAAFEGQTQYGRAASDASAYVQPLTPGPVVDSGLLFREILWMRSWTRELTLVCFSDQIAFLHLPLALEAYFLLQLERESSTVQLLLAPLELQEKRSSAIALAEFGFSFAEMQGATSLVGAPSWLPASHAGDTASALLRVESRADRLALLAELRATLSLEQPLDQAWIARFLRRIEDFSAAVQKTEVRRGRRIWVALTELEVEQRSRK